MTEYHKLQYNADELDEILAYVNMQRQTIQEPVGMKIDTLSSSPAITVVDRNGNPFTPDSQFFHNHTIWGNMRRCLIDPDNSNQVTLGSNARGDGLTLDGSAGDVMVQVPNVKARTELDGTDLYIWYAPFESNAPYFDYFPTCYQGTGGTLHDKFYMAAYEASGYLDTTFKLRSASGKIPVTGGVGYPDLPNSGRLTLDDSLLYAQNKGAGWSIGDVWSYSLLQGLLYIQYGTRDLQAALGRGIVDLPAGESFAGKLTGADDIDSLLDEWGCGVGSGINGQTPTCADGLENFASGGNAWEFIAGINLMNSDSSVRIINPDGSGTPAGALADGNYITLPGTVPMTDGYISGIQTDRYGALTFTPAETVGSSSTHYADYFWYPRYNPSLVRFGGYWSDGSDAGVGCRTAISYPSRSRRHVGARLVFHPQQT